MAVLVANRYARALADVVQPTGNYTGVLQELLDLSEVYGQSQELRHFFDTPAVSLPDKMKVLEALLSRLGLSSLTANFLRVVLSNYRMSILREIVEAFQREANRRTGIVEVKVFAASELTEAEREALGQGFAALTGKRVQLVVQVEEGLLGGIRAQIGSTIYDGSVRGHLERLRGQLMAR